MKIKRWLQKILLVILAMLVLFAYSTTLKISDNRNEIEDKLSGTIVLWQSFPQTYFTESLIAQYQEILAEYIDKFTKLYPQVKIIVEFIHDEDLVEKFKSQVEKGLGPDLIYTQSINIFPLIKAKALLPLDKSSINLLQFRPEAIDQVSYKNKLYGIPLNLNTQILCYNKNKVTIVPETLLELITQGRKGYSVGILSSFEDTFWGTGIFGGKLFDAQGNMILDRGLGWVKWMRWLKNAQNEPNFILNEDPLVLQNAFIEEKLAYNVCWSSQIPFLRESLGSDRFRVAVLPGSSTNQATPPLIVHSALFSSASSSIQTEIALKFALFLANTQQQTELATKWRAIIPANQYAIIDARLFPIQGILQEQSQNVIHFSLDYTEKFDAITNYGRDFYTKIMAGEITPEQAASQFTQSINSQFTKP